MLQRSSVGGVEMNNIIKNVILSPFNLLYKVSPKLDLELLFLIKQHYRLNLKSPKTYNEKLQWIKLYDKNPLMPKCCDKYAVREYVQEQGCGEILNELYWQGFNPEEIPFDNLPQKFVIKVTHGSTFNIICTNKDELDKEEAIRKCKKWLNAKFLPCYGEWFYGIEKPRVIVEKFIESSDDEQLRDYKVFCFNGEPKIIRVDTDRFTNHKDRIYDKEWRLLENAHMGHGFGNKDIKKPECLEEMLDYARKLSKPFYHARVDFYIVDGKTIFGEVTFTNGAGFDGFCSYEFDLKMGDWLALPLKGRN